MQTRQTGYCSLFYSTRPSWSSFSKPSLADEIIAIISRCSGMYIYSKESITHKNKVLHQTRVSSIFDASAVLGHSLRFDSTLKSFESFAWHSNQASKCSSASGSMMTKCNSSQIGGDATLESCHCCRRAVLTHSPKSRPPERLVSIFNSTFDPHLNRLQVRLHNSTAIIIVIIKYISRVVKLRIIF